MFSRITIIFFLSFFCVFSDTEKTIVTSEKFSYGASVIKSCYKKVLDFINNSGKLEPYNRQMIEDIMNQEQK